MFKAAVCREFGQPLAIEPITLRQPGAAEIEVEIRACAICHSDISYIRGDWGGTLPAIYGHEAAGVVRQAGPDVSNCKPGDRVLVTLIRRCGECRYCHSGDGPVCGGQFAQDAPLTLKTAQTGTSLHQGMATAAFAERVLVHASQVVRLPPDLPFAEASLLACGVLTGFGAVFNTARLRPGQSAAVIGCGGVGLNALQAARLAGADPCIAIDLQPSKLEAAGKFGAQLTFDASDPQTPSRILAATDGYGVDAIFVTVGSARAIDSAFGMLARNGKLIVVGMPPSGAVSTFEGANLAGNNQSILGSKMGEANLARDIPRIIEAWRKGDLDLSALISGKYPLHQINEAIEAVALGSALRNIIVFGEDRHEGH